MPIENDTQAAEVLFNAVLEDGNARSDVQAMHDRVQEIQAEKNQPDVAAEGSDGATDVTDSFTAIDPNDLPPELQAQYRSMQADYTRKTQRVAEERKQYEALSEYGGADAALEAVKFAQALATDPDYALQVHGQLTEALTEAGLTPKQAAQEAARQIDEAQSSNEPDDGYYDEDSAAVKALKQQVDELSAWRTQQENTAFEHKLAAEMERQELEIRQAHPDWSQQDIDDIYSLSYSVGGNLKQAADSLAGLKDRVLADYLNKKSGVSAGAGGVSSSVTTADVPHKFTNLFDPELDKLVFERLAQENAAGSNV